MGQNRGMRRSAKAVTDRKAGRPTTPVLSRDRIITAALELIDALGAEDFRLATLANHLSVRPSSLYNHVSGRDDILAGVQERIADTIDASMFEQLPWKEATTAWARGYRAAFIAHPQAITLFATAPVAGTGRVLGMYEQVVTGFENAGWPSENIIAALVAVESFILGSALDAAAPESQLSPGNDSASAPRFTVAVAARDSRAAKLGHPVAQLAFDVGLQAIIDGLGIELEAQRTPRGRNTPTTGSTTRPRRSTRP
jgi:AcrR family transcriptional regulator